MEISLNNKNIFPSEVQELLRAFSSELLETITDFNMEARYPDEKISFKKRCTKEFTEKYLKDIQVIREWLLKQIQ